MSWYMSLDMMGKGFGTAVFPFFSLSLLPFHFGRCFVEAVGVLLNRGEPMVALAEEDHSLLVHCFIKKAFASRH